MPNIYLYYLQYRISYDHFLASSFHDSEKIHYFLRCFSSKRVLISFQVQALQAQMQLQALLFFT